MDSIGGGFEGDGGCGFGAGVDEDSGVAAVFADGANDAGGEPGQVGDGEVAFADLDEVDAAGGPFGGEGDEFLGAFGFGFGEDDAAGDGVEEHFGFVK